MAAGAGALERVGYALLAGHTLGAAVRRAGGARLMPGRTSIEWATDSWNPASGCDKVSPGCAHCYAETFAERWRGIEGHPYEQGFDLKLHPDRLSVPRRWQKPRVIFVNSMSDLFHEDIPAQFIRSVWDVMVDCDRHLFLVLTKRPERMHDLVWWLTKDGKRIPDNVWLGVSIENRQFTGRADVLRSCPAAKHFVSAEPLLGPLIRTPEWAPTWPAPNGKRTPQSLNLAGIDWLIAGGESGPGARHCDERWLRDLRDACAGASTAFFLKQLGGHPDKRGHEQALLDGRQYHDRPAWSPPVAGRQRALL